MIRGQDNNREQLKDYAFTASDYRQLFIELALNRFKYTNTPEGIDTRYLELRLLTEGVGICFKNNGEGPYTLDRFPYLSLGVSGGFQLDTYGELIHRIAVTTGSMGYTFTGLDPTNSILIYNNKSRTGNIGMIDWYAGRMYESTLTADNNISQQKFPVIVKAPKKLQLAFKNFVRKWQMGELFILSDENSITLKNIETINTNIPFIADKCFSYNRELWNECLTRLGIDNLNIDKRERLITSEVDSQKASINIYKHAYLDARKEGIEKFNKMFGTNWQVEWNEEVNDFGDLYNEVSGFNEDA